jgi:hypothetical protein
MDNRRPTTKIQKKSKNIFTQNILVGGGSYCFFSSSRRGGGIFAGVIFRVRAITAAQRVVE